MVLGKYRCACCHANLLGRCMTLSGGFELHSCSELLPYVRDCVAGTSYVVDNHEVAPDHYGEAQWRLHEGG